MYLSPINMTPPPPPQGPPTVSKTIILTEQDKTLIFSSYIPESGKSVRCRC